MSKNYIEINENIVKIHKDGKVCTLTNPNSIKTLLDICHKNNLYFKSKNATIHNADKIIREFDTYRKPQKRKKLNIIPENIKKTITQSKLVRMNKVEKAVMITGLAAIVGIASYGMNKDTKIDTYYPLYESQAVVEELPEYVDEEKPSEVISPIINIQDDLFEYNIEENDEIIINNIDNNYEINEMLEENEAFHFEYEERVNKENLRNAKRYEDIFIKYGNRYGVDPNLLMAMAAQENCGKHYENLNGKYATGIMQIERSAHLGSTLKAYNFETGKMESVKVTKEAIEDLETNIQIGTIILRNNIEANNYNIVLALQSYNFGPGNMAKVINKCCENENLTKSDVKNNYTNPEWLNYRNVIHVGDSKYIEHVLSFVPSNTVLTIKDRDGNDHSLRIINDKVNIIQYN